MLPYTIDHCWPRSFYGVSWLPDNRGFFYLYFPYIDKSDPKFRSNSKTVLYRIGEDPKKRNVVFDAASFPELGIDTKDYPLAQLKKNTTTY